MSTGGAVVRWQARTEGERSRAERTPLGVRSSANVLGALASVPSSGLSWRATSRRGRPSRSHRTSGRRYLSGSRFKRSEPVVLKGIPSLTLGLGQRVGVKSALASVLAIQSIWLQDFGPRRSRIVLSTSPQKSYTAEKLLLQRNPRFCTSDSQDRFFSEQRRAPTTRQAMKPYGREAGRHFILFRLRCF